MQMFYSNLYDFRMRLRSFNLDVYRLIVLLKFGGTNFENKIFSTEVMDVPSYNSPVGVSQTSPVRD